MLKKVMVMLASKYLAIKTKMRAIETRLIIHSLLLRDKKMIRHLFRQRRYANLPNTVEDENLPNTVEDENFGQRRYANLANTVEDEICQSDGIAALVNNSVATSQVSEVQLRGEKAEDEIEIEEDDEYNLPSTVEDEDYQSNNFAALVSNSISKTPVSMVQLVEENKTKDTMGTEKHYEYPDSRLACFEDNQIKDESTSVIELVKNAKERQGKEFRLEDDIDHVADLFIRRFHDQIRLQKFHPDSPLSHFPV